MRGSVIIPSWNAGDVLGRCLDSLEGQDVRGGFEILVVDNGSTDGTGDVLERYGDRVRVIRNERNVGYSGGNNQAAGVATGDILFLLNSDTELLAPDTLERIFCAVEEPGVGLAGPRLLNPDGSLQPSCAAHPTLLRALTVATGMQRLLPQRVLVRFLPQFWSHTSDVDTDWLLGAAVAVPADLYRNLGGLWATEYSEEEDLALRIQQRGLKVRFVASAEIMHVGNHTLGKVRTDGQRAARQAQAELVFLRTHYSRPRGAAIRAITGAGYAIRAVLHRVLLDPGRADVFRAMARVYAGREPS